MTIRKTFGDYITFTNRTLGKTYNYFISKGNEKAIKVLKSKIGNDVDYSIGKEITGYEIDSIERKDRNAYQVIHKLDIIKLENITSLEEISNGKFRNYGN